MKATSIEQIREHLERGGKVKDAFGDEIDGLGHKMVYLKHKSAIYLISELTPELIAKWELLPIEEEKPLPGIDSRTLPIVTEDPTGGSFRDSQKERMQRIRQSLLFGHYPSLDDLRDWWQATTGERIEWGRRCNYCDGEGNVDTGFMELTHPAKPHVRRCPKCINHPGYTVRPTWMGEVANQ